MRRIGVLVSAVEGDPKQLEYITVFAQALAELGWSVGGGRTSKKWMAPTGTGAIPAKMGRGLGGECRHLADAEDHAPAGVGSKSGIHLKNRSAQTLKGNRFVFT